MANLQGTGSLSAPGDVEVSILNNTDLSMRVDNITIPSVLGGKIYHKGAKIATDYGSFSEIIMREEADDATDPEISIKNTHIAGFR